MVFIVIDSNVLFKQPELFSKHLIIAVLIPELTETLILLRLILLFICLASISCLSIPKG
jgi:F0F1-type ATP synthase membrane subunit c/vacuolar-type H+-ATPase subunit K